MNWFEGFEEDERRGRMLNWFEGFEEGMIEEMNEETEEREEVAEGTNEGERRDERAANDGMQEEANGEDEGARGGVYDRGRVGRAGGRVFVGRRSRCRLCGRQVSYANMARHERTHRVWDPGGGPYPA